MKKNLFYYLTVIMLMISVLEFTSCEDKESAVSTYDVSGVIINVSNIPVVSASIQLIKDDETTASYSATSNGDGEYTISGVEEGTYTLRINATGYNQIEITINVSGNKSQNTNLLGGATITGTIINSQTGNGLANATVSFSRNLSATSSEDAELQTTTNSSGQFTISNAPTGIFICIIEADGFFAANLNTFTISTGNNTIGDQTIVEEVASGELRVVLTWGLSPTDLDSHLTGPTSSTDRFHIYWSNKNHESDVNLDTDDVTSYGPETTTIKNFYVGMYRYSVHNYSDQSTSGGNGINQSPASVSVYDETGLRQTFAAPAFTGTGNTWRVFEMDVTSTTWSIRPINTYVQASSDDDTAIFKNSNKKVSYDLRDF